MITDEMISKCMADFDFDTVAKIYEFMKWRWHGTGIPTRDDLIDSAYKKLKDLQKKYPDTISIESGGLRASAREEYVTDDKSYTEIRLHFIAYTAIASEE